MASRQLYQLTPAAVADTNVIAHQKGDGSTEAASVTFADLRKYNKKYFEYRARLTQSGSAAPSTTALFVDELSQGTDAGDPNWVQVSYGRISNGQYFIKIRYGTNITFIQPSKIDISFSDTKVWNQSFSTGTDVTAYVQFNFQTIDWTAGGVDADSILNFTNLYIRQYL